MNSKIESHKFNELGIIVSQHGREVVTPIFGGVDGSDARTVFVRISVDSSCDDG